MKKTNKNEIVLDDSTLVKMPLKKPATKKPTKPAPKATTKKK